MGKREEVIFASAASLIELQGKTIIKVWQNLDGVEFVYESENENKSLTLRGEMLYFCEPLDLYFGANNVPLTEPKHQVTEFTPNSISSVDVYYYVMGSYSTQRLVVRCFDEQRAVSKRWVINWIWGDDPTRVEISEENNNLVGFQKVSVPPE